LRAAAAIALLDQAIVRLLTEPSMQSAALAAATAGVAILLFAGLWTPIAGSLAALVELRNIFSADSPWTCILLAALGIALAMIGPGAWSVDAHRFGWKRIDTQDR